MVRYAFLVYCPTNKLYCIKVHNDIMDWDYLQPKYIINKYRNMTYYKEQKNKMYKLFNSPYVKQLYLTLKMDIKRNDITNTDFKEKIHKLILLNKNKDDEDDEITLNKAQKRLIKKIDNFKDYECIDKLEKIEDMKAYQKQYHDKRNGITDDKLNKYETIINNLKNDDNINDKDFINGMVILIKENPDDRKIINRHLDAKQKKAIRNKLSYANKNK